MALLEFGIHNKSLNYRELHTGRIYGSIATKQGPGIETALAMLKALSTNTGNVYFGGSNVSAFEGTALAPGIQTEWFPVKNMNQLYFIMDNATDHVQYALLHTGRGVSELIAGYLLTEFEENLLTEAGENIRWV